MTDKDFRSVGYSSLGLSGYSGLSDYNGYSGFSGMFNYLEYSKYSGVPRKSTSVDDIISSMKLESQDSFFKQLFKRIFK